MRLMADPVFFDTVKINTGAKRSLINITNEEEGDLELTIKDMEKPDWLDLEAVYPGVKLSLPRKKRTPCVVNINTTHKYFPKNPVRDEKIRIVFDNEEVLEISITIPTVITKVEPFRGVFAVDFGTSNSCFAYRGGDSKATKGLERAKNSDEIASLVFFKDVSDPISPNFAIGNDARFEVKENSGATYSYLISVKRLLGQDKSLVIMDRLAGSRPGHQQEWHVEEVASFILRELIDRAEAELDQKIFSCVATFPPMFSRDRKEAIRRAFKRAFDARGVELKDEDLVTDMDEANAAAFNYVYTNLLDEFRKYASLTEKDYELLSFDFGGGTIDISLVAVQIRKDPASGRIKIETELKGLSGDAFLGGDNVTLETFKILKLRAALAAAERRIKEIEDRKAAEAKAKSKKPGDDIWSVLAKGEAKEDDMFFSDTKTEEKKAEVVVEDVDPELESIVNRESGAVYEGAIQTLIQEKETILKAVAEGQTIAQAVEAADKGPRDQVQRRVKLLEQAVETILPTRFAQYQNVDPFKEDIARKLFYELWNEADTLKIRLSQSEGRPCLVESVLRKCAKYAGVDPVCFNEITMEMAHLDKRIEPRVSEAVMKAFRLYQNSRKQAKRGIVVGDRGTTPEEKNLRLLLFGNSSNLPIVRRKMLEVFRCDPANVIFDRGTAKTSVAAGACEEYGLRKAFGKGGLISYEPTGFLDKLPFAIGVYHKDLKLVGFDTGFWPIFDRGAAIGSKITVSEKTNFLIHPELTELNIYVDNKDGAQPSQVGYLDFRNPIGTVEVSPEELGSDPNAGSFRIRLELLPTREIVATNLQTGQQFGLVPDKLMLKAEDNPFSGIF